MKTYKTFAAVSVALLLLAACGSSGVGDIFGGGKNNNYEIRGVVQAVDAGSHSVYLSNVSGYSTMLSNGGGNTVRVYYDSSTQVDYQGRAYRPEDLEPGDQVTVRVDESNNRLNAEYVTVTYDATSNSSSTYPTYPNNQLSTIRGTVVSVDTSRRLMELEYASWISGFQSGTTANRTTIYYGSNVNVDVQGRLYPVSSLERGDLVEVQVNGSSNTSLQAQRILLVRDVNAR